MEIYFTEKDSKIIAVIRIFKSSEPIYVQNEGKPHFFARFGNECQPLEVDEATKYVATHFRRQK